MKRLLPTALLVSTAMLGLSATSETILLKNGDVINAAKTAETDTTLTIDHPALGSVTISKEQIQAVYPDADAYQAALVEAKAREKADTVAAERAADEGIFGIGFLEGWDRRVELGLTGAEGNSTNLNFRAAFFADFEDADSRWNYDMVYRRATSDGEATENRFFASLTKDWLLSDEDYFYFANGRYDYDQFQDWDSRVNAFGGAGYQFLKDDTWDWLGRVGLGGSQEFGGQGGDEFTAEALVGTDVGYTIGDGHGIEFSTTFFPSLEESGEFRNITTLDYVITIDRDKGLDLRMGIFNEYDSTAPAGNEKNDFNYYASLGWSF